jgi:hypothetical protein
MTNKFHGFLLSLSVVFLFVACSSTPKVSEVPNIPRTYKPPPPLSTTSDSDPSIDYVGLQRELGLERAPENLGFLEKPFETCQAGYGYSSTQDCQRKYFVVIHFQLLCRDSEGTISTTLTSADMRPISGRPVNWTLKGSNGVLQTDSEGYGQIRVVNGKSQRAQRLKLAVGPEFLYVRAGEITRIVTPQPWCN